VVLDRGDRRDRAGPLDLVDADLREADMADLAGVANSAITPTLSSSGVSG
jgi:hypothetical protein